MGASSPTVARRRDPVVRRMAAAKVTHNGSGDCCGVSAKNSEFPPATEQGGDRVRDGGRVAVASAAAAAAVQSPPSPPNRFQRLCFPSPARQRHAKMLLAAALCLLLALSDLGKLVSASPSRGGSFNFNATHEEAQAARGHFTPMWAVRIPGGEAVADHVARHHGFTNHGRVS